MTFSTSNILSRLKDESEYYSLVSEKLLLETQNWIELFTSIPEMEFDLEGDPENYLSFLEHNRDAIACTTDMYLDNNNSQLGYATEEEAGVQEGYVEIEDEELAVMPIQIESGKQTSSPTIEISIDDLFKMFRHMENTVSEHTRTINMLQQQLASNAREVFPPLTAADRRELTEYAEVANVVSPMQIQHQEPISQFSDTPPQLAFDGTTTEPREAYEPDDFEEEVFDNFSAAPQPQAPTATPVAAKPKLDKKKKIMLAVMMLVALIATLAALFIPKKNNAKQETQQQMQPPSSLNAPAIATPMQNISVSKVPAQPVQPIVAPAAPQPTPAPKAESVKTEAKTTDVAKPAKHEEKHEDKPDKPKTLSYSDNMYVNVKSDNNNYLFLAKHEKVIDVQGQDTDNWIVNYRPEKSAIIYYTKTNNLKNTIIIKTDRRVYTLHLTSTRNGVTRINLFD